ncbi:Fic family protein [Cupriavidus gilardii]|nr:Fic family protein [Cupriavidus gilardii]
MLDTSSFQPLFPEERVLSEPRERTSTLLQKVQVLSAYQKTPVGQAVAPLLRSMNSYYSNKIEGQHTTPANIEQALRRQYSTDSDEKTKQLLAIAHIRTEEALEQRLAGMQIEDLFDPVFVQHIHRLFFDAMPAEYRQSEQGENVIPGEYRGKSVRVGKHIAPEPAVIPRLMREWSGCYRRIRGLESILIATACSHHRLAWVHPFIDGNGRVCRLHTHLILHRIGLTQGLWSPLRAFARSQETYYARLANADLQRRNDLDGRGNLSQEELVNFVLYFLDCCLDQIDFMLGMMDFAGLRSRLHHLLAYLHANPWQIGSEKSLIKPEKTLLALETAALMRPLSRGEFAQILGESAATTRRVTRSLIDFGILRSGSHRDDLHFALPLQSLRFVFPRLWPEAEV